LDASIFNVKGFEGAVVNDCQWQSEPRQAFPKKSESLSCAKKRKGIHKVSAFFPLQLIK
jgi:hypothetical protein